MEPAPLLPALLETPKSSETPAEVRDTPPEARLRIMQAAFRLFGRQGYARTSMADIAAAAGVKKPVVYYYFESKEALYGRLIGESAAGIRQHLDEALHLAPAPADARLCHLAETLLTLGRDNADPARFFFAHAFAPDTDRPVYPLEEIEMAPPSLLRRVIDDGLAKGELTGDGDALCRLVLGAIQFSILGHLRNGDAEPLLPGLGDRLVRAALGGFLPAALDPDLPARSG